MQREPPPFVWASPDENNILHCESHFVVLVLIIAHVLVREFSNRESNLANVHYPFIHKFDQRGPPDSPFEGGEYHGMLLFPSEYPFKPPGIKVCISNPTYFLPGVFISGGRDVRRCIFSSLTEPFAITR